MARYVVIPLDPETRERLADFCGKRKSYGKGINELLDCKENCSQEKIGNSR